MKNKTSDYLGAQTVVKASVLLTTAGLLALLIASLGRWSYDQMMIKHTHHIHAYTSQYSKKYLKKQQIGTLKLQIHALVHSKHTHKHSDNKHQIHSHESKFNWDFCLPDVILSLSEVSSWIICDGDIDPEWIESLNSVLDDNRLLTMPSGERIQFGPNVNFLFETHDLSCASPATISRMGMIFLRYHS